MKWVTLRVRRFCSGCRAEMFKMDYALKTPDGYFCEECGEVEEKNAENMADEFEEAHS